MDAKLTLKLDKNTIENAKVYAAKKKLSISSMVENYLNAIISQNTEKEDVEISEFVKSFSLKNGGISGDFAYKKDRQDYLIEKYNSL